MNNGKKNIVLVDDDPTNLTIGSNTLEKDYNVVTLNSGARLLKMLEKIIPDLILLDVDMPEMNGYEAIRKIKSNKEIAHIPVIFLTAKSDSASELEGLSLGAIDYIAKPFSPPLLLQRIHMHLLVESQKHKLLAQKEELLNFNEHLQEMVDEKTKTVMELQNAVLRTMAELVECRDDITGGHIERTQSYLRILIDALKTTGLYRDEISSWNLELVLQSAQLHDVGKIAIEDIILRKPGELTKEEFEKIRCIRYLAKKLLRKSRRVRRSTLFWNRPEYWLSHTMKNGTEAGIRWGCEARKFPFRADLWQLPMFMTRWFPTGPIKKRFPTSMRWI